MAASKAVIKRLRNLVEKRQVVVVVGSGVSRAVCGQAPMWRALIDSGIEACLSAGVEDSWGKKMKALVEGDDLDLLLMAAEGVQSRLRKLEAGLRWASDCFEKLPAEKPELIQAIAQLGAPILTTNYDGLIERVTGYNWITWKESEHLTRVVRGEDRRVLHLHGFWDRPDSLVLGVRSYDEVRGNAHTQAVMKALALTKTFLFVGCGEEGLSDPNFGNFLTWLTEIRGAQHFWLVKDDEVKKKVPPLPLVAYGKNYEDLPQFLASLSVSEGNTQSDLEPVVRSQLGSLPLEVSAYLERLADQTQHLTLLGMGRSLQVTLPIADAYVPLRTVLAHSLTEKRKERAAEMCSEQEQNVELKNVCRTTAKMKRRGIVMLGEPGAG